VSSLYRCQARVGYKPFRSSNLILFDERQIQDLSVKLKWVPNLGTYSQESVTVGAGISALSQSSCHVTISDPYLTGIAWPALYDAASLYTQSTIAAANGILLPPCEEGQDPLVNKCTKSVDIGGDADAVIPGDDFAMLYISLWYNVAGTSFGTDFYFRVNGFSISHGSKYPSATIKGVDARSVIFNQSLVNMSFDEGTQVEEAIKQIVEKMGYEPQFCANTNEFPEKQRLIPRSIRFKGVTPDEAISKIINSTNGTTLHLPTQKWANKVSVCARGEVQQGCTVFYLGKGLYEQYELSGTPNLTLLQRNAELGLGLNNGDPYVSETFESQLYSLHDPVPNLRKEATKDLKKLPFPGQFGSASPHLQSAPRLNGFAWRNPAPPQGTNKKGAVVINEKLKDTNLFGIAPNGTTAISFLPGKVQEAKEEGGRVVIDTNFGLLICKPEDDKKCFARKIRQETSGLNSIKVKNGDEVKISQEIGSSTAEKPEFTRFFIDGHKGKSVTLSPEIVWNFATPDGGVRDALTAIQGQSAPVGAVNQVVTPAPPATSKDWSAERTEKAAGVLLMPGHGDLTTGETGAPGEKNLAYELVKWAERNAARYGLQGYLSTYLPSPQLNLSNQQAREDNRSILNRGLQAKSQGIKAIEIHLDTEKGNSGVIPPCGGNPVWSIDDAMAKAYGAFSRILPSRGCLGFPRQAGTILEVGRMDNATLNASRSSDPATREALYAQLMDPLMKSIVAEKNRQGGAPPAASPSPSSRVPGTAPGPVIAPGTAQKICFKMGNSGTSTGPHLHAQWGDGFDNTVRPITLEQVRKYVDVPGTFTSGFGPRPAPIAGGSTNHKGVDIANDIGTPMCLKDGVSLKQVTETKCATTGSKGCGFGFGNSVIISTPEGDMFLAHLAQDGVPPNVTGVTASSGGGKTTSSLQSSPAVEGLLIETSFKGVPRALRIIPGRTILSFITDYDAWVENGGPRGNDNRTDPGIWIPRRFSNWFIKNCDYKWRDGDLRVTLEGVSQWGTGRTSVPTFTEYLKQMREEGVIKNTADYYGYIRSIGDLHWMAKDEKDGKMKDSTELNCPEAQSYASALESGPDSTQPGGTTAPSNVQSAHPTARCQYTGSRYPKDRVQGIINAARSAGITSKAAYAGIVGNAVVESRNVRRGIELDPGVVNSLGCVGIFQWCDRRGNLQRFARSTGRV
jgi:hypothetical protein